MSQTISVIVPIYNVGPYLRSCLASVAQQSYAAVEVVMVDDGSTDNSGTVAETFVAADPRFRLIRQANSGPGAARNTGLAAAEGELLWFLDSDDLLPRNALALMKHSLDVSGSDFAAGVVRRFGARGTNRSDLTPFRRSERGTHISRRPDELLMDRIATNKLWRRSFWDAEGLSFPEGVLYEDIIVGLGGHVRAKSVDVLPDTVYWWRVRAGSTTQRRALVHGIVDRLAAVRAASAAMEEAGHADLLRRYETLALAHDLRYFVDAADRGDSDYRAALVEHICTYVARLPASALEPLRAIDRLKYHLLLRDRVDDMLEVLAFQRQLSQTPTRHRKGSVFAVYPFYGDASRDIPDDVYRLDAELDVQARVLSVAWSGKQLNLNGYAYINYVDMPRTRSGTIRLLVRDQTGTETEIPVDRRLEPESTRAAQQTHHRYDGSGFSAAFNPGSIIGEPTDDIVLTVLVEVEHRGFVRRTEVWTGPTGPTASARRRQFRAGTYLRAALLDGQLTIAVERPAAVVDTVRCQDGKFVVKGKCLHTSPPEKLVLRRRGDGVIKRGRVRLVGERKSKWRRFRVVVPLDSLTTEWEEEAEDVAHAELEDTGLAWQLRVRGPDLEPSPLIATKQLPLRGDIARGREFRPYLTPQGHLGLTERLPQPTVSGVAWGRGVTLQIKGFVPGGERVWDVVIRRRRTGHRHRLESAIRDESFLARLSLDALPSTGGDVPLNDGVWEVQAAAPSEDQTFPLRLESKAAETLPATVEHNARSYTVRESAGGTLVIEAEPAPRSSAWRRQHEQRRAVTMSRVTRLRDVVAFVSWGGRRCGGDPRAIYEQLREDAGPPAVWISRGAQFSVPDGELVQSGTRDEAEVLSRARWVVTDDLLPYWWRPRRGQRVLQTWHGTPVKPNGFNLPADVAAAAPLWLRELQRQAAAWDLVLTASPAATQDLRQTLAFSGEPVEVGAPRCDIFQRDQQREDRAAKIRQQLGIHDSRCVVLWGPTARDEGWTGRRTRRIDLALPVPEDLMRNGCVFLVRGHPALTEAVDTPQWRDVTAYPDAHDLLLVADVLITDYSSLAIDFLHSGRHIVLYTPDYAQESTTDHLAIDILRQPPGPITRTAPAAFAAIEQPGASRESYIQAYESLLKAYGGPRDGGAAARTLERLFAP